VIVYRTSWCRSVFISHRIIHESHRATIFVLSVKSLYFWHWNVEQCQVHRKGAIFGKIKFQSDKKVCVLVQNTQFAQEFGSLLQNGLLKPEYFHGLCQIMGLKLHGKSIFHEYNLNFYKVDIIVNKMIHTLLCSMAFHVSQSENLIFELKTEQNEERSVSGSGNRHPIHAVRGMQSLWLADMWHA